MKPLFARSLQIGMAAIGLAACLSVPVLAGPMPQPIPSAPIAAPQALIIPVRDSWAGGNDHYRWRRHWRGGNGWHGGRHWGGGYYRNHHWRGGSGIYFGFGGLGLGAPYYAPYYDPYYYNDYYYQPRYRVYHPRRVYRGTSAHIRWCYARYRSYRAYDNTYQPNHGPRRQCRSPY